MEGSIGPVASSNGLKCAADTHPGMERDNNEDRFYANPEHGIFAVIDGIGGQAAGEVAADTALKLLTKRLERQTGTLTERLREAITLANNEIYNLAQSNDEWQGMACVLTAAVIQNSDVTVGHVGDTRLYKIQNGQIQKITADHSPIGVREDAGELTEQEAMQHPRRNEVYRDVGSSQHDPDDKDFVDIIEAKFEPDSAILLCSDGLSDLLPAEKILRIVESYASDPSDAVHQLIEAANKAGGKDNITAVLVEGRAFVSNSPQSTNQLAKAESVEEDEVTSEQPLAKKLRFYQGLRRIQSGFNKLLTARSTFFILGALLGVLLSILIQSAFRLDVLPRQTSATIPYQGKSLVVSQTGESQFSSINDALAKAQYGDTVEVSPGEYHEQVRLKAGVTLLSVKPREAIIRVTSNPDIAVEAKGLKSARIVGFNIRGDDRSPLTIGLRVIDATVVIEDVEISGTTVAGIEITGDSAPTVRASSIHDNSGAGIVISGRDARPRLVQNHIVRNGKEQGKKKAGIEIMDEARPNLIGNYVFDNGVAGIIGLTGDSKDEILKQNLLGPAGQENNTRDSGRRSRHQ